MTTFLGLLLIKYHYCLILVWVVFLFKSAVCLAKIELHKISAILCKMFWNVLHFQRFPIKSIQHYTIRQMKHQLDAALCRFYFCRVTLHVSGASAHHQEYLKLVQRPLLHVLSLQVSHHISLLGPEALIRRCTEAQN